eukprot:TRINITY_DN3721_c0_g1_i1.p1 TRINITY_DN3721_c0_g1~~TRINITY_DN3721_c0_g1_i1.p1  ORF type:complete len:261 (-),score=51.56 TRINITY_DN3721_c0_g1_i1:47-829(-)
MDGFPEVPETEEHEKQDGEEEGEQEEEDTYREPILDGTKMTFKTKILNQYLLCSLCMGYFRGATTIIECLHTFCKSCIYKYFRFNSNCPQCDCNLGPQPYSKIKYDRQIQSMVDKILPSVVAHDLQLEKKFYDERGIKFEIGPAQKLQMDPTPEKETAEPAAKKIKKSELKKFYPDEISFELHLDENENDESLRNLDKPFIRTSAKVTIKHLKKYLQKKLSLDTKELDITYRGEVLGTEHSLEYILKTKGRDENLSLIHI